MFHHLKIQLLLTVVTILLCAVIYPVIVLAFGQIFFAHSANGSLVSRGDGSIIGSRLIAQPCKGDEWFQPRPSAVDYNAAASGGSNFAASNPKLRDRVTEQLKTRPAGNEPTPVDAVTTSGSGLDPHITLANARFQLPRIARARNRTIAELETMLTNNTIAPLGGPTIVNVIELNQILSQSDQ